MLLDCTEINYGDFSLFADEGVLSLHYQLYTTDSNPGLPIGFLKHDLSFSFKKQKENNSLKKLKT